VARELRYEVFGAPDKLPLPPRRLHDLIVGRDDLTIHDYLWIGRFCADGLGKLLLAHAPSLRALEPVTGEALMRRRRGLEEAPAWRLCRGPGALCQALGITRADNGADLVRGRLRILDAPAVPSRRVLRTPRIGVDYAGPDAARPWRFVVRTSRAVSGRRRP